MPELPEVETVKRGLEPVLKGQKITHVHLRRANLRFPFPADFTVSQCSGFRGGQNIF
jgi:formamidopyrimidine-DNA glycosylase